MFDWGQSTGANKFWSAASVWYQNKEEKRERERQQDFQEQMSGTSYQRAMADMKEAGLNPILAAKIGGASTPPGAMANIQAPVSTGMQVGSQTTKTDAETKKTHQETDLIKDKQAYQKIQIAISKSKLPGKEATEIVATGVRDVLERIDHYGRGGRKDVKSEQKITGFKSILNNLFKSQALQSKQRQQAIKTAVLNNTELTSAERARYKKLLDELFGPRGIIKTKKGPPRLWEQR